MLIYLRRLDVVPERRRLLRAEGRDDVPQALRPAVRARGDAGLAVHERWGFLTVFSCCYLLF